jgi:hypothetical protein
VRERRESEPVAGRHARAGDRHPHGARRPTAADRPTAVDRERRSRVSRGSDCCSRGRRSRC